MVARGFNSKRSSQGFTLVEVLAVMIILGIVATIAVVTLNGANISALKGACRTDFQAVSAARAAYLSDSTDPWASSDIYSGTATLIQKGYLAPLTDTRAYHIVLTDLSPSLAQVGVKIGKDGVFSDLDPTYFTADGCENLKGN